MQSKLTLRLEESLIKQAKIYAKQHNKSLSRVVADYFKVMNQHESPVSPQTPITQSLIGILENKNNDVNDYKKHLENKYL